MAQFYSIHCYDQNTGTGEDLIDSYNLYTTFEKAAEALEGYIRLYIERYNDNRRPDEKEEVFEKPKVTMKENDKYCHYYECYSYYLFTICRMTVVE